MILKFESKQRAIDKKVHRLCAWHKKFLWLPTVILSTDDERYVAWLRFVYRRYNRPPENLQERLEQNYRILPKMWEYSTDTLDLLRKI
jgi:hypothetical protein